MKTYPTLYKRTTTGKVQEWHMERDGGQYRTVSGQTDGKKVTSKWFECEVKNEGRSNATTTDEQAEKEVEAKYKHQKDGGYTDDIENIDHTGVLKPMLAKNWEDYRELTFPVYSQPKLDGIRCIATKDGLTSRNGKPFKSCPHISAGLKMLFEMYPDIKLDGELYTDTYKDDFNEICSLVKKTKPTDKDLEESAKYVQYWIYDIIVPENPIFSVRSEMLSALLDEFLSFDKSFVEVPTTLIKDNDELDEYYMKYTDQGKEGQMIRLDEPYQFKRTEFLLKRKEFKTEEFNILDVIEGDGNRSGTAGYMICETADGKKFKSNIKGSFTYLEGLLKNRKKIIGKEATIKFFNLTPDEKVPRFPYVIAVDRKGYE